MLLDFRIINIKLYSFNTGLPKIMPRINEIAFFFRSAVINDDQSSEIGIGNCARDLHMSSLHALSARTFIHISFLCIDGAAIIARIPFRRHLLTPKGQSQGNGGEGLVEQIWVMWHIIRRISLMQIYGPGSGLTRVFSCLTFFFFFFFFFFALPLAVMSPKILL